MNDTDRWMNEVDRMADNNSGAWPGELDDDDPPAMPSLDVALARLAMESPEAARAAKNFLEHTDNLRTIWLRFRVSERESATIQDAKKAGGYRSTSEYLRSRVLG